jgi:hypothetical protein
MLALHFRLFMKSLSCFLARRQGVLFIDRCLAASCLQATAIRKISAVVDALGVYFGLRE